MSIRLLNLHTDTVSLELSEADIPTLKKAIADEFGAAAEKRFAMMNEVSFGGEAFIWQNEWSDPCLISKTERGVHLLKRLYDVLIADQSNLADSTSSDEES